MEEIIIKLNNNERALPRAIVLLIKDDGKIEVISGYEVCYSLVEPWVIFIKLLHHKYFINIWPWIIMKIIINLSSLRCVAFFQMFIVFKHQNNRLCWSCQTTIMQISFRLIRGFWLAARSSRFAYYK